MKKHIRRRFKWRLTLLSGIAALLFLAGCSLPGEKTADLGAWPPDDIAAELAPLERDDSRAGVLTESASKRKKIRLQ
ncbi:MAG: hypothetical protein GY862_06140 [Gammaproteobacteria bacterium]|nr:hypothetical protein [Gammaproteobacteria bacterium]